MSKFSTSVLALASLLVIASAHDFVGKNTLELTSSNYEELVRGMPIHPLRSDRSLRLLTCLYYRVQTSNGKVYFVAYFAPW